MKKRVLSTLMALALALSLLPAGALAAGEDLTIGGQTYTAVPDGRISTSLVGGVTAVKGTGSVAYTVNDKEHTSDWNQNSGDGSVQTYTYVGLYVEIPDGYTKLKATSEGNPDEMTEVTPPFLQGNKYQVWFPVADQDGNGFSLFYGGREYTVLLEWSNQDGTDVKREYVKVTRDLSSELAVAQVGNYTYETLADAIAAVPVGTSGSAPAEPTTITLLKNTNDGVDIGNSDGSKPQNIILDLGGNTLTLGPAIGSTGTETNGLRVLAYSKLEIRNGLVTNSDVTNDQGKKVAFPLVNYGTMVLTDVTVTPVQQASLAVNNRGTLVLAGNTTINNPSAVNSYEGWPDVPIAITNDPYDYFYTDVDASINVAEGANVVVGNIMAECYGNNQNRGTVSLNIAGGTYGEIFEDGKTAITVEGNITGGHFESDVSKYVVPGMTWDQSTGDIVIDTNNAVASVDGVGYTTLEEALAALKDGSTMSILPGEYDVTTERTSKPTYGSSFIIDKKNVTIQAADPNNKPVLYGFSNEFNAGVDGDGINGQGTIYVSGSGVTLKDLVIMPLGGIGPNANNWQKTVEVTSTATGFTMTGCETTPNTHQKDGQDNSMADASGNIHVSINDADISGNSFGAGTTVSAGWKTSAADTYSVDVSGNYWGDGVTAADIASKIDGNVKVDNYYADAGMTELVTVGGTPVSTVDQLEKALTAAKDGDTIVLAPGTYQLTSTLNLNKAVTVTGQEGKAAETILVGPMTVGQTVSLSGGATLKNVTVTRDNSVWDEATNKNNSGVLFAQNLTAPTTLENCIIKNNRNGVYLNNTGTGTGYAVIKNNQIIDNRTGINMCNDVDNSVITGNTINDNTTLGIVYYESGFGTNFDTVTLSGNTILGNWYGAINLKTLTDLTTGSLSVGENTIVAAGEQVKVAYEATKEPGYNAQVPSWGGGSATQPAEKPADVILTPSAEQDNTDIAGLVDYGTLEVAPITVNVHNAADLRNAVVNALPGTVINVYPGDDYDIEPAAEPSVQGQGGWYLPITASNITIQGVDENGTPITDAKNTKATIYSTTETKNSNWPTQNLIAVFGDNVTISGLTIMPKVEVNKTIEVNGKNFTLQYCSIVPNSKVTNAPANDAGILYFNGEKGSEVVKDNYFEKATIVFGKVNTADEILIEDNVFNAPAEDSYIIGNTSWGEPVGTEMDDVVVRGNTFQNLPEGYDKVILNRMDGSFILEENDVFMANGSTGDLTEMVSFDPVLFGGNWSDLADAGSQIIVIKNGVTTVLTPPATEGGEVVTQTVTVTPASASIYTGVSITLTATLEGFAENDTATWTVAPSATATVTPTTGGQTVFQASQAGQYTVTVTVGGVTASAVITVTNAPVDPVDPSTPVTGGDEADGDYAVTVDRTTGGKATVNPGRADKGDTVTITAIPNDGYVVDEVTVNGVTNGVKYLGDNKYSFTMPGSSAKVSVTFVKDGTQTGFPFTDVSESFWARSEIEWAYENGYVNGSTATTFNPNGTITRQQVWMILARIAGENPANMAEAKAWAVANGVSDGSNPGGSVTRQQLVTILYRFAGQNGYDTSARADLSGYPDVATVESYATDAMAWAVAEGIISGTTQGTLNPAGTASRAQFAVILYRYMA